MSQLQISQESTGDLFAQRLGLDDDKLRWGRTGIGRTGLIGSRSEPLIPGRSWGAAVTGRLGLDLWPSFAIRARPSFPILARRSFMILARPSFAILEALALLSLPAITRCRSGEIGIRTRLKIWRSQGHVGSSPTSGTNPTRVKFPRSSLASTNHFSLSRFLMNKSMRSQTYVRAGHLKRLY
jgi:hypothetical protein